MTNVSNRTLSQNIACIWRI